MYNGDLYYDHDLIFVAKDKNIITLENGEQRNTLIVDTYAAYIYSREIGDPIYYRRGTQEWVEGLGTIGGQGFLTPMNYQRWDFDTPLYLECICQNDFKIWSTNSTCLVCGEVKVNENVQHSISIYPNPTTGQLTINNEQLIINNVEVFDIYGRKLSPRHLITSSSHQYLAFASRNIFCKNYDRTGRGD